jgi:dephospho-CoA kinase
LADDVGFVLFGLTGGLASGKSTVAARWTSRRLPVIDADDIARHVLAPRSSGLSEVVQAFGEEVLNQDGSLDRKRLAGVVFQDAEARAKLESITHPRIVAATLQRASDLEAQNEPLACYEASLLVERGLTDLFRPLVVVAADERQQIARARARDGLSAKDAEARLRAQLPLADKLAQADYVIQNDGDLAALLREADDVLDQICRKGNVDPARYPKPDPRARGRR